MTGTNQTTHHTTMKMKRDDNRTIDLTRHLPTLKDSLTPTEKPLPMWHELLRAAIFIAFIVAMTILLMGVGR